jgi:hypothetical protein
VHEHNASERRPLAKLEVNINNNSNNNNDDDDDDDVVVLDIPGGIIHEVYLDDDVVMKKIGISLINILVLQCHSSFHLVINYK